MSRLTNKNSEKWLESRVRSFTVDNGGAVIKLRDPDKNGLCDDLVLFPEGIAEFIEVKSTGQKPRHLQKMVHKGLKRMGFTVTVIDSEITLQEWQSSILDRISRK